jgi:hypothetical protein
MSKQPYKSGADDKNEFATTKSTYEPRDGRIEELASYDRSSEPSPLTTHGGPDGLLVDSNLEAPEFPVKEQRPSTALHGGSGKHLPPQKGDDFEELKAKKYLPRGVEDNRADSLVPRAHPKPPKA